MELTKRTWVQVALVVAAVWLAWKLTMVWVLLAMALVVAAALQPVLDRLVGWGLPRTAGVAVVMLALVGALAAGLAYVVPTMADQVNRFAQDLPGRITQLQAWWSSVAGGSPYLPDAQAVVGRIQDGLVGMVGGVASVLGDTVKVAAAVASVLFLAAFFLHDGDRLREQVIGLVPPARRDRARRIAVRAYARTGRYMLGKLAVMAAVGLVTWAGLAAVGVPYAVALGVAAGVLDILPFIGPWLAALPGLAVAASLAPEALMGTALVYVGVQAAENYLLSPFILGRSVDLHPVWIFVALFVGERLLGIVGMILAVPAAVALAVVIKEAYEPYLARREQENAVASALERDVPFPARKVDLVRFAAEGGLAEAHLPDEARARLRLIFLRLPEHPYAGAQGVVEALRAAGGFDEQGLDDPAAEADARGGADGRGGAEGHGGAS